MKTAVRYYTKTGNTKRLAQAVAEAVGAEALPLSAPIEEAVDILFLGNSYYAFSIDPEVRAFIGKLDKSKVGRIVNFGSAAMLKQTEPIPTRFKRCSFGAFRPFFFARRQPCCIKKNKNRSKIACLQVLCSFHGADFG